MNQQTRLTPRVSRRPFAFAIRSNLTQDDLRRAIEQKFDGSDNDKGVETIKIHPEEDGGSFARIRFRNPANGLTAFSAIRTDAVWREIGRVAVEKEADWEPIVSIEAGGPDHQLFDRGVTRSILGTRLTMRTGLLEHRVIFRLVPFDGESLVVYRSPATDALGLLVAEDASQHEDPDVFARVNDIVLRLWRDPSSWGQFHTPQDKIVAFLDPCLSLQHSKPHRSSQL